MIMPDSATAFRGRKPTALRFGTSGLRGLVTDITDLEAYINTRGFLDYLRSEDVEPGDTVCIAGDLRPSSDGPNRSIMRAVARGIEDAGFEVENLGKIPTPALTYHGLRKARASVMITGSHIPFDRNGIKFIKSSGEVLKEDEPGILEAVAQARRQEYERRAEESLFKDDGMFKESVVRSLPELNEEAGKAYVRRYLDFFPPGSLRGKRIVVFQHSAVGRDLLVEILRGLGAEVEAVGRSDEFIAIDTEDITEERLDSMQKMVDEVARRHGPVHALVSTDGDSDRPLLVGIDAAGNVRFFGGDLLGIVVAEYLRADGVAVPISANDAVDRQLAKRGITPIKTRIGSPYVIKAMNDLMSAGQGGVVVGWEANGGFLVGSVIAKSGRTLAALPTRDAALPLLAALHATVEKGSSMEELFRELPPRFGKAGLLDRFPRETSRALTERFSPGNDQIQQVDFRGDAVRVAFRDGHCGEASGSEARKHRAIRDGLSALFTRQLGFEDIYRINWIDGVRIYFTNRDVAHVRPSGNAPQLRIYAVADTQSRADEIVRMGIKEPDGLLRQLEAACKPVI